jgi:hypothetical protein
MANAAAISLDRMVRAVEKVRQRLLRAVSALEGASIPYAIAGGNAVAAWVSTVDEGAVRNTRDVDMMLRRADLDRARGALERAGFFYRHTAGLDVFLDGPDASVRDAVHIIFANEKVRQHEPAANPDMDDSVAGDGFQVLTLEALVRIKLTAFRDKDRTHLRDLIEVGLVDESWVAKLQPELGNRLKALLEDPSG